MTEKKSIEDFMNADKPRKPTGSWPVFVENEVVAFFNNHDVEKMSIEDGHGNKAKLTRQKDNGIKVEYSSMTII